MSTDEQIKQIEKLAKQKYGEHWLAALWGSSRVLLSQQNLKTITKVLEN